MTTRRRFEFIHLLIWLILYNVLLEYRWWLIANNKCRAHIYRHTRAQSRKERTFELVVCECVVLIALH